MNLLKRYTSIILTLVMFLTFISSILLSSSIKANILKDPKTYIVLDSESKDSLPNRFRIIESLNISGSNQFTPSQVPNIKAKIKKSKLFIIDLRQESHGFINSFPISIYNPEKDLTNGFTTSQSLGNESKMLASIPKGSELTLYNKTTKPLLKTFVESVSSESTVVRNNNLTYVRFAVNNKSLPNPKVVDQFVSFVKYQVPDTHFHLHCDTGENRTTLFMSMYQMMKNKSNQSLNEILDYQLNIGGISLTQEASTNDFLNEFYKYTTDNIKTNFKVPYSKWIKDNN